MTTDKRFPRGVSECRKRGVLRLRAVVEVRGRRRTKWYPDADPKWIPDAVQWIEEMRAELEAAAAALIQKPRPETRVTMPTASAGPLDGRLLDWANAMLSRDRARVSGTTYDERRRWLHEFVWFFEPDDIDPETAVAAVTWEEVLMGEAGEFNVARLEEFFDFVSADVSGNAANKALKNLKRAWNVMRTRLPGLRGFPNPFGDIERYPNNVKCPVYVPPEDHVWALYEACAGEDAVMVQERAIQMTFLGTGARPGEVFQTKADKPPLRLEDVDLDAMTIGLWTLKTEGGDLRYDKMPMDQPTAEALEAWLKVRPGAGHDVLFFNIDEHNLAKPHYGRPFYKRQHFLKRMCRRITVGEETGIKAWTWRAYRPFVARWYHRRGHPVGFIQRLLRHESESTTWKYLKQLGCEDIRSMVADSPAMGKVINLQDHRTPPPVQGAETASAPSRAARG